MSDFKSLLTFKIEKDGTEFHAWCPELVGCHTHGETVTKALDNLKDAVQLYLDTMMEEEIAKLSAEMLDEA
ncbi:MAG: type II toxin-antitoxin system HicB family antitoxin [Cyclobacteriaceae bacterium]|nr:type II toxin-antitoxin system HicB family antitoxin [Cyclobacteriaceae bacterium]